MFKIDSIRGLFILLHYASNRRREGDGGNCGLLGLVLKIAFSEKKEAVEKVCNTLFMTISIISVWLYLF
jgi:hypothetical protein